MDGTTLAVLICVVVGTVSFVAGFFTGDHLNKSIYKEAQRYNEMANLKFKESLEMCEKAKTRLEDMMKRNAELFELVIHLTRERDEVELNEKPKDDLLRYVEEHLEENGL